MESPTLCLDALLELEARHDELLRRLDELDQRVEQVLGEWLPRRPCAKAAGER